MRTLQGSVLSFLLFVTIPSRASPPIGAVVQTWHYNPQTNMVTLQLVNTSYKAITAFNIAIKETYADGHIKKHEMLEELVGKILAAKEVQGTPQEESFRKQYGDGTFRSGEVRDYDLPVGPGLTDYQAVIDVVTYIDGTAEATNNDGLQRIVDERSSAVASHKEAIEIIKAALADPGDADPPMTASKKLRDEATSWRQRRSHAKRSEPDAFVLESIAGQLQNIQNNVPRSANKRDALRQMLDKEEFRLSILSTHAAVKAGPQ